MISDEIASFLESGISILIGTRDERLVPEAVRGCGARVDANGTELLVLLPVATGAATAANLAANGRIAITFSRPTDHRSLQIKGRVLELRAAGDAERAIVDRYRCSFAQELALVGVPPRMTFRLAMWPAHAVRLAIEGVYVQTPGPGAGATFGAAPGGTGTADGTSR